MIAHTALKTEELLQSHESAPLSPSESPYLGHSVSIPTDVTLRLVVAAPFLWAGNETLEESEFVVALSLDRNWFSPDQAKRVIDLAVAEGILKRNETRLMLTVDIDSVELPDGFSPDDSVLSGTSTFERLLDRIVDSDRDKRAVVAEINRLQRNLGITLEAAALLYATREEIEVDDLAEQVKRDLWANAPTTES